MEGFGGFFIVLLELFGGTCSWVVIGDWCVC